MNAAYDDVRKLLAEGALEDVRHGVALLAGLGLPPEARREALRPLTRWLIGPTRHDLSGLDLRDVDLRGLGLGARLDGCDLEGAQWEGAWDCGVSFADARGVPPGVAETLGKVLLARAATLRTIADSALKQEQERAREEKWRYVSRAVVPKMYFLIRQEVDAPFETRVDAIAWGGAPPQNKNLKLKWTPNPKEPTDAWLLFEGEYYGVLQFYPAAAKRALEADPFTFARAFLCTCTGAHYLGCPEDVSQASWWMSIDAEARHQAIMNVADDPRGMFDDDLLHALQNVLYDDYWDKFYYRSGDQWQKNFDELEPAEETPDAAELRVLLARPVRLAVDAPPRVTQPCGAREIRSAGGSAFAMIACPPGRFAMGSPLGARTGLPRWRATDRRPARDGRV